MSHPRDVELCPSRTRPLAQVQYADFSSIQVSQYGQVKYFEPPADTEDEAEAAANGECCTIPSDVSEGMR
jgi:hypothetical protein